MTHTFSMDCPHMSFISSPHSRGTRLVVTLRRVQAPLTPSPPCGKTACSPRLDLEPLTVDADARHDRDRLVALVDARSARRFWKLTGGNALFLHQLVNDQVAAGRMRMMAGVWMWDGDVAVSQSISDMVGRQLHELTPEGRPASSTPCRSANRWPSTSLCDLVGRRDLESGRADEADHHRAFRRSTHGAPGPSAVRRASPGRARRNVPVEDPRPTRRSGSPEDADADSQATVRSGAACAGVRPAPGPATVPAGRAVSR